MVFEMEEKVFSIILEVGDVKSDVMMFFKEIKKGDYNKVKYFLNLVLEKI